MKTYKKIILAGGTGQLGKALSSYYKDKVDKIIILSRTAKKQIDNIHYIRWDGKNTGAWVDELDGADILINLTGKNVNCRYTEQNKKEIFDSRTDSIQALAKAIILCHEVPKLWIQCASATIYRNAQDRPMTEKDGEIGAGFSVEVCKKWEQTFWEESKPFKNIRKAVLRTSLVLSADDGVLPRLRNLTRFGLGGQQGNGHQWVSWIHEQDVVNIVEWIATHPEMNGTYNCTAPFPIKNKAFMDVFRKSYGMPIGLPSPKWLLEIGAIIIGTETELILKSRWVLPDKLLKLGYQFQYPQLTQALENSIKS
jgi:uncharacterized protein (TIGR01777 family)